MLKMMNLTPTPGTVSPSQDGASNSDSEDPSDSASPLRPKASENGHDRAGFLRRLKYLLKGHDRNDNGLREAIEEYIEEPNSFNTDSVSTHERILLSNILKLRDVTVSNVMIPRADIVSIDVSVTKDELLALLAEQQYSRFPVYDGTLDEVLGTVHIKDIVAAIAQKKPIKLQDMVTEVPIVSPSMPILDLLLRMRHSRRHLALVVDEYGGIDGLVTIGDVLENIIGEIEDEHDKQENPQIIEQKDGSLLVDARVDIEEFEGKYGELLNHEEREESDTLGGLVLDVAGRVPLRGEVITHSSGMEFEIVDADPRRINRLKIRNIPTFENAEITQESS